MSDFFDNVRKLYGGLTNTQKQVADFMLEHPDVIAFKRLEELSMMIGVSTTSVIRFARSIGYKGYADMQQDIQQSIVGKAQPPRPPHRRGEIHEARPAVDRRFSARYRQHCCNASLTV